MLICVHGEINIILDDGLNKEEFRLSNPNYAVIVPPGVWRTMEWLKKDSVLLVLASDYYDESDYIRSYEEFTEFVKKEK
jgi:dTDP-4-dehydrorhamnose 3,5-epimerase-like enzyme